MTTIIAGLFEQQSQVEHVIDSLWQAGFPEDKISFFYANPAGQHDVYPIGGDRDRSPGAEHTGTGAVSGVAAGSVVGAIATPLLGPAGTALGALVGAHIGGLIGSLSSMEDDIAATTDGTPSSVRKSGMMVAVSVSDPEHEEHAIDVLRSAGATDIERAEGTIADSDWQDFDPLAVPSLISRNQSRPAM